MLSIKEITSAEELLAWKSKWQKAYLSEGTQDISASYAFLANDWLKIRKQKDSLIIFHEDGEIMGATIISRKQKQFGPFSFSIINTGGLFVSDALQLGQDARPYVNALLSHTSKTTANLLWLNIERASKRHSQRLLSAVKTDNHSAVFCNSSYSNNINVDSGSFEDYFAGLGKNTRQLLRKKNRQLEREVGRVFFEWIAPETESENEALYQEFLELEDSGWKGKDSGSIKRRPGSRKYHDCMVKDAYRTKQIQWCRMGAVDSETNHQKTIAMLFMFRRKEKLWLHKTAYDEDYQRYSPGLLVLNGMLERAFEDPSLKSISLITGYEWHERWNPTREYYKTIRIYPASVWGRASKLLTLARAGDWTQVKEYNKSIGAA